MGNVGPTCRYIWLTLKHKAFVFRAGLRTGAPIWRLVIHDWTKLAPAEAPHYGRQFFGDKSDPLGFSKAWNHHQKSNPHHWEYWIPISGHNSGGYGDLKPLPMPEWAVREMVADWYGASRAYEGVWPFKLNALHEWTWFDENWHSIREKLHPETQEWVLSLLARSFGNEVFNYQKWNT